MLDSQAKDFGLTDLDIEVLNKTGIELLVSPSQSFEEAKLVIKKMGYLGWNFDMKVSSKVTVTFKKPGEDYLYGTSSSYSKTMEEVVCRAAINALNTEERRNASR